MYCTQVKVEKNGDGVFLLYCRPTHFTHTVFVLLLSIWIAMVCLFDGLFLRKLNNFSCFIHYNVCLAVQ